MVEQWTVVVEVVAVVGFVVVERRERVAEPLRSGGFDDAVVKERLGCKRFEHVQSEVEGDSLEASVRNAWERKIEGGRLEVQILDHCLQKKRRMDGVVEVQVVLVEVVVHFDDGDGADHLVLQVHFVEGL